MITILIFIVIIELALASVFTISYMREAIRLLYSYNKKLDDIKSDVVKKGRVTDPFVAANKTNTIGASSSHIIIRKTPDQIRNENFEKIKKGATYGIDS